MEELGNLSAFRLPCAGCHGDPPQPVNRLRVCDLHFMDANGNRSVLEMTGENTLEAIRAHVICSDCYLNEHGNCFKTAAPIPLMTILKAHSLATFTQELDTFTRRTNMQRELESVQKSFNDAQQKLQEMIEVVRGATSAADIDAKRNNYSTLFDKFQEVVNDFVQYAKGTTKELRNLDATQRNSAAKDLSNDNPPAYCEVGEPSTSGQTPTPVNRTKQTPAKAADDKKN